MSRAFTVIVAFALVAAAIAEVQPAVQPLNVELKIVKNIAEYRAANPGVKLIPFNKGVDARGVIRYTLGNRVGGDRLVAQGNNNQYFPSLQDVTLTLSYPQSGTGAVVTFVDVTVDQSSNIGNGYVASGGIGQRYITVVIEAKGTSYFHYVAAIYGY